MPFLITLLDEVIGKKKQHKNKKQHHSNPGRGKKFIFYGRFANKNDAKKKEKETPGSFIREKDGYFYVMKPR